MSYLIRILKIGDSHSGFGYNARSLLPMTKERAIIKAKQYINWAEIAERKSKEIYNSFDSDPNSKDLSFWTQPAYNTSRGRSFQREREQLRSKIGKSIEFDDKAKRFREKAANLMGFANRNKGDAEREREKMRQLFNKKYHVGDRLKHWSKEVEILKIHKLSASIMHVWNGMKSSAPKHLLYTENIR